MATIKDFRTNNRPTWCPGCGDYAVLSSLQKACADLGLEPEEVVLVSGIGCSGKISQHFGSYGFHSLHGRALPTAQGVKLANQDLTVIAAGGDGDGYGIGMGHFVHAVRRNVDLTYIVMDNHIYGLTTGQLSPTSDRGFKSKTSPQGSAEEPVKPVETAIVNGASFVAQAFSGDVKQ
ncbi:MAG: thiamine pyrophosphate-dependent enzyme, partial [Planifilum sp.]